MSNIRPISLPESKEDALAVIDSLRKAVEEGQIVAFAAVGIEPDDCTRMWCASVKKTTRLKMAGAITTLLWHHQLDSE
jgi:hypothetical protein